MNVGAGKTVFGILSAVLVLGLAVPVLFLFVARAADKALGLPPILAAPTGLIAGAISVAMGLFWVTWSWSYIVFVGKGLPLEAFGKALHPTTVLVTAGPYAYARNPMVLGYVLILLGIALVVRSIAGVVAVPVLAAAAYVYLVTVEEKVLLARFGSEYQRYRRSVPALFPRLSSYVHGSPAAES